MEVKNNAHAGACEALQVPRTRLLGETLIAGEGRTKRMAWPLAVTAPNAEFRVADAFAQLAFPHFLFRTRERIVQRGRVVDRIVVAFPRYIFVFVIDFAMYRIMVETVRGVIGFVRDGDEPGAATMT